MPKSTYENVNPKNIVFAPKEGDTAFWNARQNLNDEKLKQIYQSIRKVGLVQDITVRLHPNGKYQVVCGEQRLRCILKLIQKNPLCYDQKTGNQGKARVVHKTLRAKVLHNCSDKDASTISVAENLNRDDVSEIDLMAYCIDLTEKKAENGQPLYTRADIEDIIGRSATWISQTMNLYNLPGKVKKMLGTGELQRTVALNLLKVDPARVDQVIEFAQALSVEDYEKGRDRIEKEVTRLEGEFETAEIEEASADAMGTPKEKRQTRTARSQLDKMLNDAKSRQETARNRKSRLSTDLIQTAASALPGALKGKASGLSHKLLRSMVADIQEHLDSKKPPKHRCGKAYDARDLRLAQAILKMSIGQTQDRDVLGVLAHFYAEEGEPGWPLPDVA